MKKIAILGATGYIGKSLVFNLLSEKGVEFFLFARSKNKLNKFLKNIKGERKFKSNHFKKFNNYKYDTIINCVGIGNPSEMKKSGVKIFEITEEFDNLILKYLLLNPKTLYINLSSGAAYGKKIEKPIENNSYSTLNINNLDQGDAYSIVKINSEAKHRTLKNLNIVDLRIFSFFSRFLELGPGYLISDIINSIKNKTILITKPENIIRDYINPRDLLDLIKLIIKKRKINDVFDVYSAEPVSKFDLLKYFKKRYDLKYKIKKDPKLDSPTGIKNAYYSKNKKANKLGYKPKFSSLMGIDYEINNLL